MLTISTLGLGAEALRPVSVSPRPPIQLCDVALGGRASPSRLDRGAKRGGAYRGVRRRWTAGSPLRVLSQSPVLSAPGPVSRR